MTTKEMQARIATLKKRLESGERQMRSLRGGMDKYCQGQAAAFSAALKWTNDLLSESQNEKAQWPSQILQEIIKPESEPE